MTRSAVRRQLEAVHGTMGGHSPLLSVTGVARSPLGPLIWSSRFQTTAGIEGGPSSAKSQKSCAESLRATRRLYPSDFRGVTPTSN